MSLPNSIDRVIRVAAVIVACSAVSLTQGPPMADHGKKAVEVYKNIQVLKDVPSDQLIPAMQFISSSLGVQCGYCHVENAFDKDDKKPKQIARKMMQMEFDIDTNNFQGKQMVTCYSCHRGNPAPQAIPAIAEGRVQLLSEAKEPGASDSMNLPKAEEILSKYVASAGGTSAISKLATIDEKGSVEVGGRQFPAEVLVQSPDRAAMTMQFPNGSGGYVFDGQSGWSIFPGRPARPMTPAEVEGTRLDANLQFALDLNKIFTEVKTVKATEIGGRDALMITGQRQGMPPIDLYFDKQSGLLIRMVRYGQSPLGLNPVQVDYSDYRDVAGVKVAFHLVSSTPTGHTNLQLESARANVDIPPTTFQKPTAAPPAAGK
ncbi:MAG TPA: c-type cytochrome [Terriglobales bacterium]|nr:c-type cytochrome [Terriglobales bacterium]